MMGFCLASWTVKSKKAPTTSSVSFALLGTIPLVLKTTTCWTGVPIVIHINYFMGVITLFFFSFFFEGATLIGPSSIFLGTLGTPH
jgi:hypothetical protein